MRRLVRPDTASVLPSYPVGRTVMVGSLAESRLYGVARLNEVTLRRARLVLGWVKWTTVLRVYIPSGGLSTETSYPGQLSLAIPPWLSAVFTDDGLGHR